MIFDIVEYIIMNGQCQMNAEYAGYAGGCLCYKKVEECCWPFSYTFFHTQVKVGNLLLDSKTKQGRLRGRQVLRTTCSCKRVNTVEKQ